MALSWLQCIILGFVCGLTEFLPVSSAAHRSILLNFFGAADHPGLRFSIHLGALAALFLTCGSVLSRLNRERKIASIPKKRRKRQPDLRSVLDMRLQRIAAIPVLISFLIYPFSVGISGKLWLLSLLVCLNGILLFVPRFLYSGNRESQTLSGLDALSVGLGAAAGMLPGLSRTGLGISFGLVRGADRKYISDFILLLSVPTMLIFSVIDLGGMVVAGTAVSAALILKLLLTAICSFLGAWLGIFTVRFLAFKAGYSGFSYYCWGFGLLVFFLYLI